MPHTHTHLIVHIVFSTKNREPYLTPEIQTQLHPYIGGIIQEQYATPIMINGIADHVHILLLLPPTITLAKLVATVKANSSKWLKTKWRNLNTFSWQEGYGAFSVSQSAISTLKQYIATQEEHHRTRTFQEEFIALLKLHNITYDEQYLW